MYVVYQSSRKTEKENLKGTNNQICNWGKFSMMPQTTNVEIYKSALNGFFSNVNTIKIFALDNYLWNFRILRTQKNFWKLPKRKTIIQRGNDALHTLGAPWHSLRLCLEVRKCLQELGSTSVPNNTKYWVIEVNRSILWHSKKYIWSLSLVHSTELLKFL